jgi:hypothetical protein
MRRENDFLRHGSGLYREIPGQRSYRVILVVDADYALMDMPTMLIETVHCDPSPGKATGEGDGSG